jgi:hypothetical protein
MEATMSVRKFMHGFRSVYRNALPFDWEGFGELVAFLFLLVVVAVGVVGVLLAVVVVIAR